MDAQAVINAGAEGVATVVSPENLAAVIEAYNAAITTTYVSCFSSQLVHLKYQHRLFYSTLQQQEEQLRSSLLLVCAGSV